MPSNIAFGHHSLFWASEPNIQLPTGHLYLHPSQTGAWHLKQQCVSFPCSVVFLVLSCIPNLSIWCYQNDLEQNNLHIISPMHNRLVANPSGSSSWRIDSLLPTPTRAACGHVSHGILVFFLSNLIFNPFPIFLELGTADIFCKGPDNNYFWLCQPYGRCQINSA